MVNNSDSLWILEQLQGNIIRTCKNEECQSDKFIRWCKSNHHTLPHRYVYLLCVNLSQIIANTLTNYDLCLLWFECFPNHMCWNLIKMIYGCLLGHKSPSLGRKWHAPIRKLGERNPFFVGCLISARRKSSILFIRRNLSMTILETETCSYQMLVP